LWRQGIRALDRFQKYEYDAQPWYVRGLTNLLLSLWMSLDGDARGPSGWVEDGGLRPSVAPETEDETRGGF
jgi:hypothetical protein